MIVKNFDQPIRNAVLDFQDGANPQVKFLPVNVLIADFDEPLPRYPAGLTVGALAGGPLKPGGGAQIRSWISWGSVYEVRRNKPACCTGAEISQTQFRHHPISPEVAANPNGKVPLPR
jgi:hypothetical protein